MTLEEFATKKFKVETEIGDLLFKFLSEIPLDPSDMRIDLDFDVKQSIGGERKVANLKFKLELIV